MYNTTHKKQFKEFKRRIILESVHAPKNTLYGLTREHIELVLGIPIPLLLEVIDTRTKRRILYEQYLFENIMANLASGAKTFFKGKAKEISKIPQNFDQLKEFLQLLFEHPKWLEEFTGHLKDMVDNITEKLLKIFANIKNSTDAQKNKLYKIASNIMESFESFIKKFKTVKGWSQATIGIGIVSVGSFLYNKLVEIAPSVVETVKASATGASTVSSESSGSAKKSQIAGGAIASTGIDAALNFLTKNIGSNVISGISGLATGGLYQALNIVASAIGGISRLITAIQPALQATIFFASRDPEQGQGVYTKNADEPTQDLEDFEKSIKKESKQIKLADLIFEQ
jgi:hypothetical protein